MGADALTDFSAVDVSSPRCVPVVTVVFSADLDLPVVDINNVVSVENLSEVSKSSNQFVNVPMHAAATINLVHSLCCDRSDQINWLNDSSEGEFVSDHSDFDFISSDFFGGSDPGNDFSLVRANVGRSKVSRGRGRGRGYGRGCRRR
ncbi:hypothetical protein MA16_Dca008473 [Dendrobium catenatum]|uniref:Uncharacterized protein n=1 Tax=Dendrobium catenatum TaxID=906689 RepID=A0A2I0XHI0_9ASPA|nr:hypothetical protein MA16_Dca008473 [Dendrobium catenatum]